MALSLGKETIQFHNFLTSIFLHLLAGDVLSADWLVQWLVLRWAADGLILWLSADELVLWLVAEGGLRLAADRLVLELAQGQFCSLLQTHC